MGGGSMMGGASQPMGTIELHADTVNINVTGDAGALGGGGAAPADDLSGMSDDDEIEIVDDSGEDGLVPASEEEEAEEMEAPVGEESEEDKSPFGESVNRKGAGKAPASIVKENKQLKEHLHGMELLTARSIYLNKFLSREDLSRDQKRKIVEYLDSARTLAEAKTIYGRIKLHLENAKSGKAQPKTSDKAGSSSAPAKSGAAQINESTNAATNPYAPTAQRWMQLAGITSKSR